MKVSLQWAQSVSNVDITTIPKEDLLKKMGAQLGAIEEVIEWGPRYNGIVVVKVVKCEPHPNADTLHVCLIDDGRVTESVERNNDGYVQVVCGAPNVHTDMLAVWLPPNTTVPSTLNKDPFVLGVRDLRGVMSNGMLASPAELGISDNHDGILEVTVAEVGEELARPGTSFKKLYGMDDIVIDCENKMFTHRPDCFGILGVAREIAGITGQKFTSPDWYLKEPVFKTASDLPLRVNVASKLVPRFMAVVLDNVRVEPSPLHMQAALTRVGIRPINNIVDITNWLMHLTGQPLHAYDYDKLANLSGEIPTLDARMVHDNETITLLNGNTIPIQKNTIVIATDKQSVALAGVMGGASTEVDSNTKSIVLEVATFDMFSIRRTSMRHGLFTDAVTRFTKGQSPLQNDRVLHKAILMMQEIAGATQASDVYDHKSKTVMPLPVVEANIEFVNTRLGSSLSTKEAIKLLENVECSFAATQLQETRSYLKTGLDLDQKIERIGVKIVEKTPEGHYKLVLPAGTEEEYEKLIALELEPGNWCEYVGAKSAFLFKDRGLNVTRYDVTNETEHEIVEMCRVFANDYFTSLDAVLGLVKWYKPLLPLKISEKNVEHLDYKKIIVSPPFWRRDLELSEDLVEEIGRLHGFDALPIQLPKRTVAPSVKNSHFELLATVRAELKAAGANELVTYSFVHERLLEAVGQDKHAAFHIRNALSPDLQYYRLSITPSLLDKVHQNIKAGYDAFALYEFGRVHSKADKVPEHEVPVELNTFSFVIANAKNQPGSAIFAAKKYLDFVGVSVGLAFDYEPVDTLPSNPLTKPFDAKRSAVVSIAGTSIVIGVVGEYRFEVLKALKLPTFCAGFEINTTELLTILKYKSNRYIPLNKFPSTKQDITLEVLQRVSHKQLTVTVNKAIVSIQKEHNYIVSVQNSDIYAPEGTDKQRISYTITLSHPDRTLTTEEVNRAMSEISRYAVTEHSAVRI